MALRLRHFATGSNPPLERFTRASSKANKMRPIVVRISQGSEA